MNNILEKIEINYDNENNILYINLPKNLKIKINNLDCELDNEFNINVNKEINLICHNGPIHIDSHPSRKKGSIHLNSYISRFSKSLKNIYNNCKLNHDDIK